LTPSAIDAQLFAAEAAEYLQRTPRQLPSKYFYDALGSSLFEAICHLPWYRVTRAESAMIARHGGEILRAFQQPMSVAELGCGNGVKLEILLQTAGADVRHVHLIDISAKALEEAIARLTPLAADGLVACQGTYEQGLIRVAAARRPGQAMLVLFLGSNIGNFDPPVAQELLSAIRRDLRAGDGLLLGSDLVKPEHDLLLAYDDPLGVTAAFNRNLLRRINDELGGTFDLDAFAHRAVWNGAERRVEMHLVSQRRQIVRIAAADLTLQLEPGEWIWTESSHKYEPAAVVQAGRAAGFAGGTQWVDDEARFALTLFAV
jgi:dimethylhistidine N-methyltransferase